MTETVEQTMSRKHFFLAAIALVAMTVVAYIPAMRGGFIWDDNAYVTENKTLRSPDGLRRIWFEFGAVPQYYPLVHTTFWMEYHLWELNPHGYHIVNVLLHAISAVLLWFILRRLKVPGAYLAAGIFALHPVHVESVAWITERKNVLSGVFYFLAMLTYFRFHSPDDKDPPDWKRWNLYALSLVLFACALLSKTVACSLPAAILVLLLWKRRRISWKDLLPLISMLVLGAGLALVTIWMEKRHVGAAGKEWSLTIVERFLIAGRALWFYAGKLLVPYKLTFNYPRWGIDDGAPWQYLFPAAAVGVMIALWVFRRRIGAGPLVAVLLFAGTLFPALGFFDVYPMRYSFVADHFQHLASIALIALFAAGVTKLIKRLRLQRGVVYAVCAVFLVVLGVLTWNQGRAYKDLETLWKDTIRKNPNSWMATANLASFYRKRLEYDRAIPLYRKALELRGEFAEPHEHLGTTLLGSGDTAEAIKHLRRAIQLAPDYDKAHFMLAVALGKSNLHAEAVEHYRHVARIHPEMPEAHYELAKALERQRLFQEAIREYREAIRLRNDFALAYEHLGRIYFGQGAFGQAEGSYRSALHFNPNLPDAHAQLGSILADRGDYLEADAHLRTALRIAPKNPVFMIKLAWLLATCPDDRIRNGGEAVSLAQHGSEATRHTNPAFLDVLAAAYAEQGDFDKAVSTAQQAVGLAVKSGQTEAAKLYQRRLDLYKARRPYRQPPGGR